MRLSVVSLRVFLSLLCLPLSRAVENDDYCDDVRAGLDETGTSACSHLSTYFTCANRAVPRRLFSSRVGDNVCDCCDGSDEGNGKCPDTCGLLIEEARRQEAFKIEQLEMGRARKREVMERSLPILLDMRNNVQKSSSLLPEYERLREVYRVKLRQEEETEKVELEGAVQQSTTAYDAAVSHLFGATNRESKILLVAALTLRGKEEAAESILAACLGKYEYPGPEPDDTEAIVLSMDSPDDSDDVLLSPETAPSPQPPETLEAMSTALSLSRVSDVTLLELLRAAFSLAKGRRVAKLAMRDSGLLPLLLASGLDLDALPPSPTEVRKAGRVRPEAAEAREKVSDMDQRINLLKDSSGEAERALKMDFGRADELWPLHHEKKCFAYADHQYQYNICPFGEARQSSTLLGTHDGAVHYHSSGTPKELVFVHGDRCLGTSDRRERLLRLTLECSDTRDKGREEYGYLSDLRESEVCVYEATLHTPLVC